jgi:hypothetical protein
VFASAFAGHPVIAASARSVALTDLEIAQLRNWAEYRVRCEFRPSHAATILAADQPMITGALATIIVLKRGADDWAYRRAEPPVSARRITTR